MPLFVHLPLVKLALDSIFLCVLLEDDQTNTQMGSEIRIASLFGKGEVGPGPISSPANGIYHGG